VNVEKIIKTQSKVQEVSPRIKYKKTFDAMTRKYRCHVIYSKTTFSDDNKLLYISVIQNVRGESLARRALARQHNYDKEAAPIEAQSVTGYS